MDKVDGRLAVWLFNEFLFVDQVALLLINVEPTTENRIKAHSLPGFEAMLMVVGNALGNKEIAGERKMHVKRDEKGVAVAELPYLDCRASLVSLASVPKWLRWTGIKSPLFLPENRQSEATPEPQPELDPVPKATVAEPPPTKTSVKEARARGSSRRGAPTKWTKELYQALLHGLSKEKDSSPSLSDRRLVLKMVKSDPEKWNAKRGDTKDIARVRDNLCKRLSDAKALTEQTK